MNKKLKKAMKIILVIVILVSLLFFIRFVFGGPEDTWICSAGEWIKHGNPTMPIPNGPCN
ncbi:MAG: hypothetical protein WC438_04235 [Candidatus Pacearchaeota archaeon]